MRNILAIILLFALFSLIYSSVVYNAKERNILFLGQSQSGKSTSINVLRNSTFYALKPNFFTDTELPEFHIFTTISGDDSYTLKIIDTPGLFEQHREYENITERINDEIISIINDCLNFEITYLNHIFLTMKLGNTFSKQDIKALEIFAEVFQGVENYFSILITHAQDFTEDIKANIIQGLKSQKGFSQFMKKAQNRVFFLGAVNELGLLTFEGLDPSLRDQLRNMMETRVKVTREEFLKFIYSCESAIHVKALPYYKDVIRNVFTLMDRVDSCTSYDSAFLNNLLLYFTREKQFIESISSRKQYKNSEEQINLNYKLENQCKEKIILNYEPTVFIYTLQKSEINMNLVHDLELRKVIKFTSIANGHNNDLFSVTLEADKSYELDKGTIWLPEDTQKYSSYQPLVQKNRVQLSNGTRTLFMYSGDLGKTSPKGISYIPTRYVIENPNSQDDVWKKLTPHYKQKTMFSNFWSFFF